MQAVTTQNPIDPSTKNRQGTKEVRILQEGSVGTNSYDDTRTAGKFRAVERKYGDIWITITFAGGRTVEFRDYNLTFDGHYSEEMGQYTTTPRDIIASPHRDNLIVFRHIDADNECADVYRIHGRSASLVLPPGVRINDACLQWYCHRRGIRLSSVTGKRQHILFQSWTNDNTALFLVSASNGYYDRSPGVRSVGFYVHFDFARRRIFGVTDYRRPTA